MLCDSVRKNGHLDVCLFPTKNICGADEQQVCTLVKHCLKKESSHPIFDDCFTVLSHRRRTRNNNLILKLSTIKLEASKQSFYFDAAIIFNQLLGKRMFKIDFNVLILNLIIILAVRFHAYPEFRILINSLS